MTRNVRTRVERLDRAITGAAVAAIDRLTEEITDGGERSALLKAIHAATGTGPPADAGTASLAEQALARMWNAATELERCLLWGSLPLPRPEEVTENDEK